MDPAAASLLKRVFGIDEVLLAIYGFLLGTDMNSNAKIMKLRLVSSRFNHFYISCLRTIPLQLKYMAWDDGPREGTIVRWLKRYDIGTLFKLVTDIEDTVISTFCEVFDGLDLSNLQVLDLSITQTTRFRANNVRDVYSSFARASSLSSLKLHHNNRVEWTVFNKFLSFFPVLNSLDVNFRYDENISRLLAYPKKLEHLVQHKLDGRNLAFRSESVKTLDMSSCRLLRSIISIDCPSLEKIICRSSSLLTGPIRIAGINADTLVKQFGNTDKDFIADYVQSNIHQINCSDIESIASISVVPMDYITGRNTPIKVSQDCVIVLFAFDDPPDDDW